MAFASDTLIIKHLPYNLDDSEKEELLKHFGAKDVKCLSSKLNKYNVVFARFQNEQIAYHVLHRLHQINLNGSLLSVEFSKGKDNIFMSKKQVLKDTEDEEKAEDEKNYKRFIEKMNSWHSNVNFKQPVPCHLRYHYPPPNNTVLLNIAKVLATVPKFYTQVLHLMNKMNLPCPFGKDIMPDFNILFSPSVSLKENKTINSEAMDITEQITESIGQVDTSESEISSDDEIKTQKEMIPNQPKTRKKKLMNLPKFVKPMTVVQTNVKTKKTNIEEVFEKPSEEKEIKKIKLSHPSTDVINKISCSTEVLSNSPPGFGYIQPISKNDTPPKIDLRDEREEERLEKSEIPVITPEELAQNRIPEKDRLQLPVFKNYAEGIPTCRIYIKNLSKTVTEEDLRYIYNRYLPKEFGSEADDLHIRLMQEGRMKGQAFVTFQSVQQAQTALNETNGFILKEKPLVVQFARSGSKN